MLVLETWTGAWQQLAACLGQMAWLRQARICGQPATLNAPLEGLEVGSAATIHYTNLWNHPGTPYYGSPFWSSQSTSVWWRLRVLVMLQNPVACLQHVQAPKARYIDLQHVNAIGVTAWYIIYVIISHPSGAYCIGGDPKGMWSNEWTWFKGSSSAHALIDS